MDRSADPCEDLYQYACGGWMAANPIPPDQARWSVYAKMANENQRYLWSILDKLSAADPQRTANQTRMGDYFAACMDESAADRHALTPLRPLLSRIDALKDRRELPALLAALHLATNNERVLFHFTSGQDMADSTRVIAFAYAGGLSLPDREYYFKADDKSRALRDQFIAHVARSFRGLLGDTPEAARTQARQVMALETALARASLSRVDKRDPYKGFHPMKAAGLQALTPGFDWAAYQRGLGLDPQATYNVTEPAFFKAQSKELRQRDLAQLRNYLRWQLVSSQAPTLSGAAVQANFEFFGQTLQGVPQLKARWKRCVRAGRCAGSAMRWAREFVARNFSPDLKDKTLTMTKQIEDAMAARIRSLSLMSETTKQRAQEKLHAIVNKVGYPDRWRDYGAPTVARDDFAGNVMRGNDFDYKRHARQDRQAAGPCANGA